MSYQKEQIQAWGKRHVFLKNSPEARWTAHWCDPNGHPSPPVPHQSLPKRPAPIRPFHEAVHRAHATVPEVHSPPPDLHERVSDVHSTLPGRQRTFPNGHNIFPDPHPIRSPETPLFPEIEPISPDTNRSLPNAHSRPPQPRTGFELPAGIIQLIIRRLCVCECVGVGAWEFVAIANPQPPPARPPTGGLQPASPDPRIAVRGRARPGQCSTNGH